MEEYDPVTDQWTAKSSMNYPRFELTCTVIDDEIWAMYGFPDGYAYPLYPHYEIYKTEADNWTPFEDSEDLHPDGNAAIHAISADRLYILGGYSGTVRESLKSEVYVYDARGLGVRELANQEFRLFPNPAGEQITIWTNLAGPIEMEITTLNGQLIHTKTIVGPTLQFETSTFQKGAYLITIGSKDFVATKKLIKL